MNSDFKDLLRLFNDAGVKYLIVGGMAFIFHAEPRYTKDLDLWISPDPDNAAVVYSALRRFGAPLANITPQDFANPDLFYQMGRPPARVDILMSIPGLDFELAWSRRVEGSVDDLKMPFVSRDDLISSKLGGGQATGSSGCTHAATARSRSGGIQLILSPTVQVAEMVVSGI